MKITDIKLGTRHRRDLGDIAGLAASIAEIGLLHPVVVTPDGTLIAGARRIAACRLLGWTDIPVTVVDIPAIVRGEYAENTCRKDFAPSEAVAIWQAMENYQGQQLRSIVERSEKPIMRAERILGTSHTTLSRAHRVVEAAKAEPEKYGQLVEQMDRTGNVSRAYREIQRQHRVETPPLPAEKHQVIYADPPWRYEHSVSDSRQIENQYPTMSQEEICALPITNLADDDCTLLLWATSPKLAEAMSVIIAWGFNYRTCAVWTKDRIGMGYYFRQQHELLLVATRGTPQPPDPENRVSSIINAPRGKHSEKPQVFYEIIERMYPHAKRIELFARENRERWAAWGNEIGA